MALHVDSKLSVPVLRISQSISIPLKYLCLFTLVIQTSTLVLALRYSRKTSAGDGKKYLPSTAVVVSELFKLFTCCMVLFKKSGSNISLLKKDLRNQVFGNWTDSVKLMVPAILYTLQNNLLFMALSYLDAATYQVTYQLKILTTAMFSVVMLGRHLNPLKWISLIILMFGVVLVQLPSGNSKDDVEEKDHTMSGQLIGLVAVLIACFSSGFAGVYFEKLLKGSKVSLWMRNVVLVEAKIEAIISPKATFLTVAFYGIIFGVTGVIMNDFAAVYENGYFQGYTKITWFVIILQAYGGLLVAAVVKYADNILKGFATSISILVSSVFSYYFFGDFDPSLNFIIGATGVLTATYLYSLPANI